MEPPLDQPVEPLPRLLLIGCPDLMDPDPDQEDGGQALRRTAALVEALAEVCPWIDPVRPGVLALPVRGPTRYFGGEAAVRERVADLVATVRGPAVLMGVAEGIFAASLAALSGRVVPPGGTPAFLAPWPVSTLAVPDLTEVLVRLGLRTLGDFAAIEVREVLARFGNEGATAHRLAAGLVGERPGYRVPDLGVRLAALVHHVPLRNHQAGFWGGGSDRDDRAAEVLVALQRQLGPEAVVVATLTGGRGPADRVRFAPWRADAPPPATGPAEGPLADPSLADPSLADRGPWPGRLPPPFPARVPVPGSPAQMLDRAGGAVEVTSRGLLTGPPARLSVAGEAWSAVTGWSAPWPVEEGWWSPSRRRSVRLQVVTADGAAHLLIAEGRGWRVEATYD